MRVLNALSLVGSINIGRRAIAQQQVGLQVTGKNIANVNTPGYTRQQAVLGVNGVSADTFSGEQLPNIRHTRDQLTESLLLQERSRLGGLKKQSLLLSQIETVLNEPSDSGLNAALSSFFASAESLANEPENDGARNQLIERGKLVASRFNALSRQLETMRNENLGDARALVRDVNGKLEQVRILNVQIARAGDPSSQLELQDEQMRIIRDLAETLGVQAQTEENGTRTVQLNGISLVQGTTGGEILLSVASGQQIALQVRVGGNELDLTPRGGTLDGLIRTQNEIIPAIENDLHAIAATFIDRVNAVHPGFFRDLTDPQQRARAGMFMQVLVQNAEDVTPSTGGTSGGNDVALSIADLQDETQATLGDTSILGFYRELVSAIGSRTAQTDQARQTSDLVVQQLEQRRESISGVSLDEESTNLIMFQRAYQASARYIQVVDDLLNTLIQSI